MLVTPSRSISRAIHSSCGVSPISEITLQPPPFSNHHEPPRTTMQPPRTNCYFMRPLFIAPCNHHLATRTTNKWPQPRSYDLIPPLPLHTACSQLTGEVRPPAAPSRQAIAAEFCWRASSLTHRLPALSDLRPSVPVDQRPPTPCRHCWIGIRRRRHTRRLE